MSVLTGYLVGAGAWIAIVGFNHALYRSKWTARAFFAFPVWPVALVVFAGMGLVHLWKTAEWDAK